jgi:hypothetical protein
VWVWVDRRGFPALPSGLLHSCSYVEKADPTPELNTNFTKAPPMMSTKPLSLHLMGELSPVAPCLKGRRPDGGTASAASWPHPKFRLGRMAAEKPRRRRRRLRPRVPSGDLQGASPISLHGHPSHKGKMPMVLTALSDRSQELHTGFSTYVDK